MSIEMRAIGKILALLSPREKRRGAVILALVIMMATLEVAGVASILPFLAVLGDPALVETNTFLAGAYATFGFGSIDDFLIALGVVAFGVVLFAGVFRAFTAYAMTRYIEMRRHSISERLLETYLRQPYSFFLDRHSGDMAKNVLSEVDQLIVNVFRPGLMTIAYGCVCVALIGLLVAVNPVLALVVAAVFFGLYTTAYFSVRGLLGRIGQDRVRANRERFEAASEALGGIKDIKLLGREHAYLSRFRHPSVRQAKHQATNEAIAQIPSFLIEALAFGSLIAVTVTLLALKGGAGSVALGEILPLLGLYAFAGLRLRPAAQNVYRGFSKMRFGKASVDAVYDDLIQRSALAEIPRQAPSAIPVRDAIALRDVHYTYPGSSGEALAGINLEIPVGTSIGLVGATGAGKTTLVDLILGLLRPTAGSMTIDGVPVTDSNLRAWQQALGYVPQEIFLIDATIMENIAFGVARDRIDFAQVVRCARVAQIDEFVVSELPQKYDTVVGERGVRLSGGQRQRIGIARALYHDPSVIVFDEATSALDRVTEKAVMRAIEALSRQKTLIIIAHRLATVHSCDKVVFLEHGNITASGAFQDLLLQSERFRSMAGDVGH